MAGTPRQGQRGTPQDATASAGPLIQTVNRLKRQQEEKQRARDACDQSTDQSVVSALDYQLQKMSVQRKQAMSASVCVPGGGEE